MHGDGRLAFYGADGRVLAEVGARKQDVMASHSGSAVALCNRQVGADTPVQIYNSAGHLTGRFDVKAPWKVSGVSDDGHIVYITIVTMVWLCEFDRGTRGLLKCGG